MAHSKSTVDDAVAKADELLAAGHISKAEHAALISKGPKRRAPLRIEGQSSKPRLDRPGRMVSRTESERTPRKAYYSGGAAVAGAMSIPTPSLKASSELGRDEATVRARARAKALKRDQKGG